MIRTGQITGVAALVMATVFVVSIQFTQAAVSQAVRDACERKANKVTPPLRAGEREAYIANCIADATVDQGKRKKRY